MKHILTWFLTALIVIALAPVVLSLLMALSPLLIVLMVVFSASFWRPLRRLLGGTVKASGKVAAGGVSATNHTVRWLFNHRPRKSRFMGWWERRWRFSSGHAGILIDGHHARLSEKASYESLFVQGGMGRGKSSVFVMPNLLMPPRSQPSFVISDTSGDIYRQTSGYLAKRGYTIRVLNLMQPDQSENYNPLARANTPQQIGELAQTLVSASRGNNRAPNDPFWEQSAEKLIRLMAQCLHNQPDPKYRNLANLRHLITSFDAHITQQGQLGKIDQFVLDTTKHDQGTFNNYQAFTQGNLKTIQSVLMTADVALDQIATPEMAALTATNSLDFSELRQRPTAMYILVNETQMSYYAFLLNLFYAELFRSLLTNPHNPGRPVWLFLDEFGHLQIPGFEVFATNSRKYNVAYALFLQSAAQLESRYGALNARTILEALGTEIYLPGVDLETARNLEARLGRTGKAPLMAASNIIRMKANRALMLPSNHLPARLKTKRHYQQRHLRQRSTLTPAPLPSMPSSPPNLYPL